MHKSQENQEKMRQSYEERLARIEKNMVIEDESHFKVA
jgi:1,2-phenylacetyl-CoA epoxidase catalytic subunit